MKNEDFSLHIPESYEGVTIPHDYIWDPGIARVVRFFRENGVETYESCEGGEGHSFSEPTVRFHGLRYEGLRVVALAQSRGLPVYDLWRLWSVIDGELTGPDWAISFGTSVREMEL